MIRCFDEYISEIQNLNKVENSRKLLFYRGVSDEEYKLIPKIFRDLKYNEKKVLLGYKQYLPQTKTNYHYIKDRLMVLANMQHNGIPTRLLDYGHSTFETISSAVFWKAGIKKNKIHN